VRSVSASLFCRISDFLALALVVTLDLSLRDQWRIGPAIVGMHAQMIPTQTSTTLQTLSIA